MATIDVTIRDVVEQVARKRPTTSQEAARWPAGTTQRRNRTLRVFDDERRRQRDVAVVLQCERSLESSRRRLSKAALRGGAAPSVPHDRGLCRDRQPEIEVGVSLARSKQSHIPLDSALVPELALLGARHIVSTVLVADEDMRGEDEHGAMLQIIARGRVERALTALQAGLRARRGRS